MNLLIDFLTARVKTGGGEYLRRIVFELLEQLSRKDVKDVNLFVLYDSSLGIAYEDMREDSLGKKHHIIYLDCHNKKITELIKQNNIDRFFIACAPYMIDHPEIADIKCETISTIHDLCYEENFKNKIYTYFDLIEPNADKPKNFSRLGIIRKMPPFKKILNRIDNFSFSYIRYGGKYKYSKLLEHNKPVIELHRNNKKSKLIAVSEYSKSSIMYNYSISDNDIQVLYSPERVNIKSDRVENKTLQDLVDQKKKYYLMVSANRIAKNPYKTIAAFKIFAEHHPDCYLATIGFNKKEFLNHIALPFLSDNDLALAYANCYAIIYPSFFEGFGYPPLEAMHYGKPVLCSNTTSMPEIFENAPIYFSPFYESAIYHALIQLSDENYNEYSQRALEQYKKIKSKQEKDILILINMLIEH